MGFESFSSLISSVVVWDGSRLSIFSKSRWFFLSLVQNLCDRSLVAWKLKPFLWFSLLQNSVIVHGLSESWNLLCVSLLQNSVRLLVLLSLPCFGLKAETFFMFFFYYRTLWDKHIRLRHYLSKISHRFRIFLLLQFLVSLLASLPRFSRSLRIADVSRI